MKQKYNRREFYIPDKDWQQAKKVAFKKGITVSALIRQALEKYDSKNLSQ